MVFVSHDRYFIDKLATRVFEIADGEVQVYPGNYEDYLWRKEGGGPQPAPLPVTEKSGHDREINPEGPARAVAATEKKFEPAPEKKSAGGGRLNPIKLRQMKQRRQAIEDEVTRLEVEIADYEAALANFKSVEETIRLSELLAARRSDLTALMSEWEQVAELIETSK